MTEVKNPRVDIYNWAKDFDVTRSDPLEEFKLLPLKILEIREDPNGKKQETRGYKLCPLQIFEFSQV